MGHVLEVAGRWLSSASSISDFAFTPEFFSQTYSFWAGLIGGAFLTTASHGTEQLMVQRLLAARTERESRLALFSSWVVILFQFTLFLTIGVILFVYYGDTGLGVPKPADRIYPEFIWNHLPPGIAGLVIAAILAAAMSNLSAALNSLASTTVMDFYKPHGGAQVVRWTVRDEAWFLRLARRIRRWPGAAFCWRSHSSRARSGRCSRRVCRSPPSYTAACSGYSCWGC